MTRFMKKTAAAAMALAAFLTPAAAFSSNTEIDHLTVTASAAYDGPPGTVWWGTVNHVNYWEYPSYVAAVGVDNANTITSINIPEKINGKPVTTIHMNAFCDCKNLTKVSLPRTLTYISAYAFENCAKLEEIDIPYNVMNLPFGVFSSCPKLKKVIVHGLNTTIDPDAFGFGSKPFKGTIYCNTKMSKAAEYVCKNHIPYGYFILGDVNNDGLVDASDASQILGFYASLSTGNMSEKEIAQAKIAADVDRDGMITSCDASFVLKYYSMASTGYAESLEYYMANR